METLLESKDKKEAESVVEVLANLGNAEKRELLIFAEGMRAANILRGEEKTYARS